MLMGVRMFGNPFSNEVSYRVEYSGKPGSTVWANYTKTKPDRTRSSTTEQAVGQLPLVVSFTTGKHEIVAANGSTTDGNPVTIKIYKHGAECSSSDRVDRVKVTDTVVCR
jgi:hypothetical protein